MAQGIFRKPLKGVALGHYGVTMECATEVMPVPDFVYIVMSQHLGPPCTVLVKPGDPVAVGQIVGNSDAYFSAPIHSGVSGEVARIDEIIMPNGSRSTAVVIKTDKQQREAEDLAPPVLHSREDFIAAVRNSGVVGLGGAGFPTHVKLSPKNADEIDTLMINAAECEPYITSDYRTLMEDTDDALDGIRTFMKFLNIGRCVIGIEDDKPKAIALWTQRTANMPGVSVKALTSKYPQGAEKVLIYETTGRIVPEGQLPSDVGVIVVNVTTAARTALYLKTGRPLTTRRITVDGGAIAKPKNIRVVIGTTVGDIAAFCGGCPTPPAKILMGGPMMGTAVYDEGYPVLKSSNAVLFLTEREAPVPAETPCIRCGQCVRVCPMNLMPLHIEDCFTRGDLEGLRRTKVNLCIECGCCAYGCPAKRQLVHTYRLAKARLRAAQAKEGKV